MRMETHDGKAISNPDERQIDAAVEAMTGGDAFLILSRDEMNYMQAAGDVVGGFVLEYQEGDTDDHFAAADGPHSTERVSKALRQYALGDTAWRTAFQWERISF
ncbi:MAG TPA: hypothetical protein P5081_24960 [Phycisphaerae bacterium]|nr:hypothetical protein [Phycisphaerae bacterium]HRW56137.1 hypothetical protein [Phycisphaerae bacterium]